MLPALGLARHRPPSPRALEAAQHADTLRTGQAHHDLGAPALATNGGWIRMIGDALVEQTARQLDTERALPQSEEGKAHQARRKRARSIARSKRGGLFGYLKAMALTA